MPYCFIANCMPYRAVSCNLIDEMLLLSPSYRVHLVAAKRVCTRDWSAACLCAEGRQRRTVLNDGSVMFGLVCKSSRSPSAGLEVWLFSYPPAWSKPPNGRSISWEGGNLLHFYFGPFGVVEIERPLLISSHHCIVCCYYRIVLFHTGAILPTLPQQW